MVNKGKLLAAAGLAVASVSVFAACSNNQSSSSSEKDMNYIYAEDPVTLDYLVSNKSSTSEYMTNGIDGLLENDKYGNLIPSLAEDWKVSADGLTYTYTLRKGVMWYTSDGEEYAEVKAQDFVTGLKHAADAKSASLYVVQDSIKGLSDYVNGNTTDFSTVGVKALDDYTVQYTLNQAEPYWNSKTTYSILWPLNADFLKSKGDKFGSTDPSNVLYNGAFILKELTSKSSIELDKNENYWDADKVNFAKLKFTYNDLSDTDVMYKLFDEGKTSFARLFPTKPIYTDIVKKYGDNIIYSDQSQDTYFASFNVDRSAYEFTSKISDKEKADTKAAILNKDFRQAITFAFNREAYNAQSVGKEGASHALRNTLVPPGFVTTSTGGDFGSLVRSELQQNYGSEWSDIDLSDAQNGLYNPSKAKESFEKAKSALESQGVSFPIHLDIPVVSSDELTSQQASSFKQSIEENLGSDNVVLDLQKESQEDYLRTSYYAEAGNQIDYDISLGDGWQPDYADPSTYLDNFNVTSGSQTLKLGLDKGSTSAAVSTVGLDQYRSLLQEASKITDNLDARYTAYAKAQAFLTDSSLIIPIQSLGATPRLTKFVLYTNSYSTTGNKGKDSYKYSDIQDKTVTAKEYKAAREKWLKEKSESNAQYQKDLANHIEN